MSDLTTKAAEIRAGLVKPLEWRGGDGSWSAQALRGVYGVYAIGGRYRLLYSWSSALWDSEHTSLEEAKTAALAEHESRILSALNLDGFEQQAAELAEARRDTAAEEARHGRVVQGFVELCEAVGVRFDAPEAVAYEINAKIGNAIYRATTAESERDELLREKERLGAGWRPIETAPKDGTLVDLWHDEFGRHADCFWGFPEHCCGEAGSYCDSDWHSLEAGWVDGTLNASLDASDFTHWHAHPAPPALENAPAGLADAHSKSPAPSSQSERIAVLEAALRGLLKGVGPNGYVTPAGAIETARARSALAPLGEK